MLPVCRKIESRRACCDILNLQPPSSLNPRDSERPDGGVASPVQDAIGTVEGIADDAKTITVKVSIDFDNKSKYIATQINPEILEPQSKPTDSKEEKKPSLVAEAALRFLNEPGGASLQVL